MDKRIHANADVVVVGNTPTVVTNEWWAPHRPSSPTSLHRAQGCACPRYSESPTGASLQIPLKTPKIAPMPERALCAFPPCWWFWWLAGGVLDGWFWWRRRWVPVGRKEKGAMSEGSGGCNVPGHLPGGDVITPRSPNQRQRTSQRRCSTSQVSSLKYQYHLSRANVNARCRINTSSSRRRQRSMPGLINQSINNGCHTRCHGHPYCCAQANYTSTITWTSHTQTFYSMVDERAGQSQD